MRRVEFRAAVPVSVLEGPNAPEGIGYAVQQCLGGMYRTAALDRSFIDWDTLRIDVRPEPRRGQGRTGLLVTAEAQAVSKDPEWVNGLHEIARILHEANKRTPHDE